MWRVMFGVLVVGCGSVHGSDPSMPDATDEAPVLVPSNGDVIGALRPTGLALTLGTAMFDTGAECTATAAVGACAVVPRDGLAEICVCRVDTLTIDTLHVRGPRALAILAWDTVTVRTLVDASGDGATPGPGASRPQSGDECTGGSFGSKGGSSAITAQQPGEAYGTPDLVPLEGGMIGGQTGSGQQIVLGGGGGGAIQITAGNRIDVLGAIVAGGGGGMPNLPGWAAGGGGGSGGAILLESRVVSVVGSVAANGGGGGGSAGLSNAGSIDSEGVAGANGGPDANAAGGGRGGFGSCISGATGGNGSLGDGPGQPGKFGTEFCSGKGTATSGGGGGAGRIRINSASGCACSGIVSPPPSVGQVVIDAAAR